MYQKYTGIILKRHALGEADELLTIYTRESGKLRVKVRAVRKPQSRLSGHLQTLNEIEFETAKSIKSSHSLPVLTSVRAKQINNYLRNNLRKFALALVGAETVYRISPDLEQNESLYKNLCQFFSRLGSAANENFELRKFQLNLLEISGFQFPLEQENLSQEARSQISSIKRGAEALELQKSTESAIDSFLHYVLEREIKSSKFADKVK